MSLRPPSVGEQAQDAARRVRSPTGCLTRKVGRVIPAARAQPSRRISLTASGLQEPAGWSGAGMEVMYATCLSMPPLTAWVVPSTDGEEVCNVGLRTPYL